MKLLTEKCQAHITSLFTNTIKAASLEINRQMEFQNTSIARTPRNNRHLFQLATHFVLMEPAFLKPLLINFKIFN